MVQRMVGKCDEDNRLDLVVEKYPEELLSCVTLESYSQHTFAQYSIQLTFPVPGGLIKSSARSPGKVRRHPPLNQRNLPRQRVHDTIRLAWIQDAGSLQLDSGQGDGGGVMNIQRVDHLAGFSHTLQCETESRGRGISRRTNFDIVERDLCTNIPTERN